MLRRLTALAAALLAVGLLVGAVVLLVLAGTTSSRAFDVLELMLLLGGLGCLVWAALGNRSKEKGAPRVSWPPAENPERKRFDELNQAIAPAPVDSAAVEAVVPGERESARSQGSQLERQVVAAFETIGWSVTSTDLPGAQGALMVLEKDGLRVAVQCVVRPNGTVSYLELRQYFNLLDEAFRQGRIQKAILLTSGNFDAETAEAAKMRPIQLIDVAALAQLDPAALTRQLLESAAGGQRTRDLLEARDGSVTEGRLTSEAIVDERLNPAHQAIERQVVAAFEATGWSVTSTDLPGAEGALMVLEKDGLRVAVQSMMRPNGTVSDLELRRYFNLLDEAFRQGRIQKAILLTSGNFDAETAAAAKMRPIQLVDVAALAQLDPAALTRQLLESAAGGERTRDLLEARDRSATEGRLTAANQAAGKEDQLITASEPPRADEDLLRQDAEPGEQRVLTVGGVWFPPRGNGEEARVAFFRRLGTLCLLAGQDPYPVPIAALRDYLRIRGLVSPAASVLKMLAPPRIRVNEGARAQAWLDTSTEAAEARAEACLALEASLTLDAYLAKLRECLAARQNKSALDNRASDRAEGVP